MPRLPWRRRHYRHGYKPRLLPDATLLVAYGMPLIDMAVILGAALLMTWVIPEIHDISGLWPWSDSYRGAVMLACLFSPLVLYRFDLYSSWRGQELTRELSQLVLGWLMIIVLLAVFGVVTKTNILVSRVWFFSTMSVAGLGWAAYRLVLRRVLATARAGGANQKRVYLVGWGDSVQRVCAALEKHPSIGYRVMGIFTDTAERERPQANGRFLGDLDALCRRLSHSLTRADQVWVTLPMEDMASIRDIYLRLMPTLVDVRYVPSMTGFTLINSRTSLVAGLPLVHLSESPMGGVNRIIKGVEDRVLALLFLIISSPVMLLVALAVKLSSPGPIIFRQKRHGWNGEAIHVWKFRTMYIQPKRRRAYEQAKRNDPRVTPVGRWLRRLSLDELPQFINVLQGSMSVVGPRPHPVQMNAQYRELMKDYMLRHRVKPGITGWAQVNGFRGETQTLDLMKMRVEYDLYYIEHWSVWFDLYIVAMTALWSFFSPRAY